MTALPDPEEQVQQIIVLTSRIFDVPHYWILGNDRRARVFQARAAAMASARRATRLSYPALGRLFGGRAHTTVMYAVNQVAVLRLRSPRFDRRCRKLELAAGSIVSSRDLRSVPAGSVDDAMLDLVLAVRRAGQLDAGRTKRLLGELLAG